jgi:hypothetical protein
VEELLPVFAMRPTESVVLHQQGVVLAYYCDCCSSQSHCFTSMPWHSLASDSDTCSV